MFAAFKRLLFISITALMFIFAGWALIRGIASQQVYAPFNHPIMELSRLQIVEVGKLSDFQPPQETPDNVFYRLRLVVDQNGKWFHMPIEDEKLIFSKNGPAQSIQELFEMVGIENTDRYSLEKLLSELSHLNFFFDLQGRTDYFLQNFVDLVEANKLGKKSLVYSKNRLILRSLRKKAPRFVFGIDPTSLQRAEMLDSLWLSSLADLSGDFVVIPAEDLKYTTESLINELKKRHKKILLKGPESMAGENAAQLIWGTWI